MFRLTFFATSLFFRHKKRLRKIEHLQQKEIITWDPYFSIFIIYTKSCFCIIWTSIVAQNTESLHKLWMVHSRMLVQYNNREMVLRWFLYLPSSFTLYSRDGGRYKNPEGANGHNRGQIFWADILGWNFLRHLGYFWLDSDVQSGLVKIL